MEYNSSFLRSVALTVPLNHRHDSLKGVFYGASLAALNSLLENDYALVGCTPTGVNAFWVRRDLDLSQFAEPFIAGEPFSGLAVPSPSRQSGGLGSGVGKRRRRFSSLNSIY